MMARRRTAPLAFVVLDVPQLAGETTIGLTFRDRRQSLVAKGIDSRYEPEKRSPHWREVKCAAWREQHSARRHER